MLFGFTESLCRYHQLRQQRPDAEILMGVGNVTELTDADTNGINTLLIGIASELGITPHSIGHRSARTHAAPSAKQMWHGASCTWPVN